MYKKSHAHAGRIGGNATFSIPASNRDDAK